MRCARDQGSYLRDPAAIYREVVRRDPPRGAARAAAGGPAAGGAAPDPRLRHAGHRGRPRLDGGCGRAGRAALRAGAPILVDATMVAAGIRRSAPAPIRSFAPSSDEATQRARGRLRARRARRLRSTAGATGWRVRWSRSAMRRPRCSACWSFSPTGAPRAGAGAGLSGRLHRRRRGQGCADRLSAAGRAHHAARPPRRQRHGRGRAQRAARGRAVGMSAHGPVPSISPGSAWSASATTAWPRSRPRRAPWSRRARCWSAAGGSSPWWRTSGAERLAWRRPLEATFDDLEARRGRRVVVLASGDPMCFGVGETLARRFAPQEMRVLPAPSAFSLVCARLGWSRGRGRVPERARPPAGRAAPPHRPGRAADRAQPRRRAPRT